MTKHYLGRHQWRDLRSISRSHDTHMHDLTQQSMPRQAHAHATSLTKLYQHVRSALWHMLCRQCAGAEWRLLQPSGLALQRAVALAIASCEYTRINMHCECGEAHGASIRSASTERSGVQAYNGSVPRDKIRRPDAREKPLHIASGRWFKERRTCPKRSGR